MSQQTVTIVGQGYVGLPLAQAASRNGWKVYGLDVTESLVDSLNDGHSHVDDLDDSEIQEMLTSGYSATTDPSVIADSEVVVICVPTPLADGGSPDLGAVKGASRTIGDNLVAGTTVILESTTYPGTTDDLVRPILELNSGLVAGEDFQLAYSPERVDPGSKKFGIKNTPKLMGGINDASTQAAVAFYRTFVDEPIAMKGMREAETAKLLENTFRHVNIALVNEMTKFCKELNIDIWEVIRGASTKPFGFMKFTPGPGVGGHCIPIDPNYLSYEVRNQLGYPFRFVELAQEINNSMPKYVVDRVSEMLNEHRKPLNGSSVLLLGVTYKADIADQRESPAIPVADLLQEKGAHIRFHDPLVDSWKLASGDLVREDDLDKAVEEADAIVVLQAHDAYDLDRIASTARLMLDTRGVAAAPAVRL
ncbi:nucleotide sugar dehydrogenase [Brevibacterium iodinum ATCC 49514]|uniref:Nucleotide sugar dehydrogenase n=1 Tax=Brevibacterium iodinum ATCC 49514 TaxID=1255616 RepID=A0A2H1KGP6_9MICO|nr:nucleotide sugar dehydrogenase [Brevibacterium iodinum]SMX98967.1 nucleotide sugar dehydrogenase [Brevibacterium iodinum ATCC 49514]SUW14468.1 UDP-glucose 6-dehydrogenase tuaD [Brevibacterium iodinum]